MSQRSLLFFLPNSLAKGKYLHSCEDCRNQSSSHSKGNSKPPRYYSRSSMYHIQNNHLLSTINKKISIIATRMRRDIVWSSGTSTGQLRLFRRESTKASRICASNLTPTSQLEPSRTSLNFTTRTMSNVRICPQHWFLSFAI